MSKDLEPEHAALTSDQRSAWHYLWVELARKVLGHPHAGRAGLELLLVQHAVHLTGLAAGGGGAGPGQRAHGKEGHQSDITAEPFSRVWPGSAVLKESGLVLL